MNRIYWIKVLLLIASPLATAAQNRTLRKWERAFEALRLRNKQDAQKRLEIAPSHHKEEFNPYQGSYDYFEPTRLSKEKYESHEESQEAQHNDPHRFPYHSKEISQEHRALENHVVHAHKDSHTDQNYSDEDYNSDHRKEPPKYSDSEKEDYHQHSTSDEVESKPHSGETPLYRKTPRYRPPHLYSGTPLVPHDFSVHSPYYHAPFRPRIYLPYRPSHRFKERTTLIVPTRHKPPYGSKIQNVHSKHYHDSDYYEYPVKTKYSSYPKITKPEYASSSYFVGSQRSKYPDYKPHYPSYSESFKGYRPSYDYPDSHSSFPIQHHTTPEDFERKPDPYYASEAYSRDKTFGVNPLEKGISIPLNISSDKFSKPDPFVYPGDKYSPSHIPERKPDLFSPSYGPSGYPKEKYSPRVSYSSSFDPNDARFKYPAHPFISSSSDTRDTYLKSGSNKEEQLPYDLAASQTFGTKGRIIKTSPEVDGTYYYYTYRTPQGNKDFSPSLRGNNTIKLNVSIKVSDSGSKLSQSSEDSTILTLPPVRGENGISYPECSLNENGTFCLHDSQYPYASVNNAINKEREKLQKLLSEIPVNETSKVNLTGTSHSPCQVKIRYSALLRALNSEGKWKIIVKLPQNYDSHNYSQIVRLEQCYVPGSSCGSSNLNSTGKCLQKYVKRTLLSLNSEMELHLDTFYLPSACVCHSEENQNSRPNQRSRKWKQEQKQLRIG